MAWLLTIIKALFNNSEVIALKLKIEELEAQLKPPAPPKCLAKVNSKDIRTVLRTHFGYELGIILTDKDYELSSVSEYNRFLEWYTDTHRYVEDEYNCNDFAWVQRAGALKWMHGKSLWGYIEGSGNDPEWRFPNHAFNFVVDNKLKVWICDELEIAAPSNEFIPCYDITAYSIRG